MNNVNQVSYCDRKKLQMEKESARINAVVINWRYLYEFTVFNILVCIDREVCVYMCSKYTHFLSLCYDGLKAVTRQL